MAVKILLLAVCLTLSHGALVKRDTASPLEELQKNAAEFQKTFSEQMNKLVNSKNAQDVNKAIKDGTVSVVDHISQLGSTLQNAIADASGKTKEVLEQSKANLERTAEDLRKAHPEVEQQATALKDRLTTAVRNTIEETQKLAKEASTNLEQTNDKLAPLLKKAYDDFAKSVQEMQSKIHEAANKQ